MEKIKHRKEFGKELHNVSHCIKRRIDQKVTEFGLTSTQSRVLHFISCRTKEGDCVYQKDVEEVFDVRKSSVTSILQLLEKNGYLTRESVKEDARLKQLKLTKKGIQTTEAVHQIILDEENKVLSNISPEEQKIFFEILDKISKALKET